MSRVFKLGGGSHMETLIVAALQAAIDEAYRAGRMATAASRNTGALNGCLDEAIAALEHAQRVIKLGA